MRRLIIAWHLAVLMTGVTVVWGGTLCPVPESQFPAPASEVVEIISGWFTDQGYSVRRDFPRPGTVHLAAWNSRDEWDITVRPHSALASVVTVIHDGATSSSQACQRLLEHVNGDLLETLPSPPPRAEGLRQTVPTAVLDRIETVVCIRGRSKKREVQFSGFVVDPDGLVLCTAHDLADHQRVTVTFHDGASVPGTIVRLDLHQDLALVECPAGARAFVSLSSGRNLLGMGESVFSIGCPNNLRGTLARGTINGPPRLVKDQPLWQVEMEIYPGSSGSPVFDAQGQLVAMVKGRYRGTTTVGFLTPLETIIAFLLNSRQ
jgi:serine protease Do